MTISNAITPTTNTVLIPGNVIGGNIGYRFAQDGLIIPDNIPDLGGIDLNYFRSDAVTDLNFTQGSSLQIGTYDTCWVTIEGMGRKKLTWNESAARYKGFWSDTFRDDFALRLGKMLIIKFELMDP